jgi:hemerythrin-like metal-binding protein
MNAERLEWTPGLAFGDGMVDCGHAELIRLYNRIVDGCEQGDVPLGLRERVRSFLLYARWHFGEEEQYMRDIRYPLLGEHKLCHDRLLQDAEDFVETIGGPLNGEDVYAVARYFHHWLARHMLGYDQRLWAHVSGNTETLCATSSQSTTAAP